MFVFSKNNCDFALALINLSGNEAWPGNDDVNRYQISGTTSYIKTRSKDIFPAADWARL